MEITDAIILGFVQGITEFLPVSFVGHYLLIDHWLTVDTVNALAYSAASHLAIAVLATMYFWSDIWTLIQAVLRKLGRLPVNQRDLCLFYALALGTVPAFVVGFFFESIVASVFQSVALIAGMILLATLFYMYAEWRYYVAPTHEGVTVKRGWLIGVFQVMALIPGFSRTGVTVAGGMLVGLTRYEATRFSFLLAIPISLGISVRKLIELIRVDSTIDWLPVMVGTAVAITVAFLALHFFLAFMKRHTLWIFIWYGVVLASLVGYVAMIT